MSRTKSARRRYPIICCILTLAAVTNSDSTVRIASATQGSPSRPGCTSMQINSGAYGGSSAAWRAALAASALGLGCFLDSRHAGPLPRVAHCEAKETPPHVPPAHQSVPDPQQMVEELEGVLSEKLLEARSSGWRQTCYPILKARGAEVLIPTS